MRTIISLVIIVFAVSACSLGAQPASEIKLTVIPMEDTEELFGFNNESTEELPATFTPTFTPLTSIPVISVPKPTNTPVPPTASIRNTSNCSVRTDLPTYTVISGDSLSNIAIRYNTTANQLAQYNCLSDANLISVGMSLRVPIPPTPFPSATMPTTPAPTRTPGATPTITNLGIRGTLGASPVIEAGNPSDWNDYLIAPQTAITISWTGIEPEYYKDIVSVTFVYTPDGGSPLTVGVDNTMSDGMLVTWTPPAGVSGTITGNARTAQNGFYGSSTLHLRDS